MDSEQHNHARAQVSIHPLYEVKESAVHHRGCFAIADIPKGTKIVQYTGEKITKEESKRREQQSLEEGLIDPDKKGRTYIFELNDEYDIDGEHSESGAQYMNHSCNPNCEVDGISDEIWIVALKDIKKGEELTYNYNFDFETATYEEHPCYCNAPNCQKYIVAEEDWPFLHAHLRMKNDKNSQS